MKHTMMKSCKNLIATVALATVAVLILLTLCSCVNNGLFANGLFDDETLADNEVRYDVRDGVGYLRWAKQTDAKGYLVYRSESRFGNYKTVGSSPYKKTQMAISAFCYWYYKVTAVTADGEREMGIVSAFGDSTLVVSPNDDMTAVQGYIDQAHDELEKGSSGQFSSRRLAIVLLPGEYPDLDVKVGYYTTVSGVGDTPKDVKVGNLYVSDNVLANKNSTCTFWRGVENLTVDSDTTWAVSQGTSMRRAQINGNLTLSFSGDKAWSSGGFLANSVVNGTVDPGSQQQWLSRNDEWTRWKHVASHNYVFSGCEGDTPASVWTESKGRSTVLNYTERMAEKPFLVYDGMEDYSVFVPLVETDTKGVTWADGLSSESGYFLSLDEFYIANERDTAATLNAALKDGYNLLFPAGHYLLDAPLEVDNDNTVILGMGYATLEIANGNRQCAIKVADVDGVRIADILVEVGAYSDSMIVVGQAEGKAKHLNNPTVLSNVYFRIGGVTNTHTETDTALVIYANDTICDNTWIWRGDHSKGVAWEDTTYVNDRGQTVTDYGNPVQTGIMVAGDNVACYGLMVEHCESYQTLWTGNDGLTVMYQCETPYRVPSQDKWMSPDGKNGCASYKVADSVNTHRAYGIGIYLVNYNQVNLASAIEVPEKAGINMQHLVICNFTQTYPATISNVINDFGGGVGPNSFRRLVEMYPIG